MSILIGIISALFYVMYVLLAAPETSSVASQHSADTLDDHTVIEETHPVINLGLEALGLDIPAFIQTYNRQAQKRYPNSYSAIYLPKQSIEKGLINDVLRYTNPSGILLTISAQKHTHQIEEITLLLGDDLPIGAIAQSQAMIVSALSALPNMSHIEGIEYQVSDIFVQATTAVGQLIEQDIANVLITVTLNPSGTMLIRLSKPQPDVFSPEYTQIEEF